MFGMIVAPVCGVVPFAHHVMFMPARTPPGHVVCSEMASFGVSTVRTWESRPGQVSPFAVVPAGTVNWNCDPTGMFWHWIPTLSCPESSGPLIWDIQFHEAWLIGWSTVLRQAALGFAWIQAAKALMSEK